MSSLHQVRRKVQGDKLAPHPSHLQAQTIPALRKTHGHVRTEDDKKQEGSTTANTKPKSSSVATRLQALMRVSTTLSSAGKKSGQPPAIHPPWNKARIGPIEEGGRGREKVEGKAGGVRIGFENGGAGKRENKRVGRDEAVEIRRERGGREEVETWGRNNRGGGSNNAVGGGGGGGIRPEHRGWLPGLLSSGQSFSRDGSMVIDGSYFQMSTEASKPPAMEQKLSGALSLISLARRLQGPARVGGGQWSNGESWDTGKMYGSMGDMSVSALVSKGATGEEGRRWEFGEPNSSIEGWWRKEQRFRGGVQSDSETGSGSKESLSEFSFSDASSHTLRVPAETDEAEYDTETEKTESDSGNGKEEESQDEQGEWSESETEDERKKMSRKPAKRHVSDSSVSSNSRSHKSRSSTGSFRRERSSRRRDRSGKETDRKSSRDSESSRHLRSTVSSSRPKTSRRPSREATEPESEEESEESEEEVKSAGLGKPSTSRQASSHTQSDISSGPTDSSDDLSPIMEDSEEDEEEEKSSDHDGEEGEDPKDEEEGDLGVS